MVLYFILFFFFETLIIMRRKIGTFFCVGLLGHGFPFLMMVFYSPRIGLISSLLLFTVAIFMFSCVMVLMDCNLLYLCRLLPFLGHSFLC